MLLDTDSNRLHHMIEAASEAIKYAKDRSRQDVETDPPLKHLLVRNLEIVGEAASRMSPELRMIHPEIPWRTIMNTRNRLIHAYFDIDLDVVWSTVREALPDVLPKLQAILERGEQD